MKTLDARIRAWRENLSRVAGMGPDVIRELEEHLRSSVQDAVEHGASEAEAFDRAVSALGGAGELGCEFRKVNPRRPVAAWVTWGAWWAVCLAVGWLVGARVLSGAASLPALHVFAVTMGYVSMILAGFAGAGTSWMRLLGRDPGGEGAGPDRVLGQLNRAAIALLMAGLVLAVVWLPPWREGSEWDLPALGIPGVLIIALTQWQLARCGFGGCRERTVIALGGAVLVIGLWMVPACELKVGFALAGFLVASMVTWMLPVRTRQIAGC